MGGSTYPRNKKDDEHTRPLVRVARGPKLWMTKGSWLRGVPFPFLILCPEEREFNLKKRTDEGDLDFY